MPPHSITTLSLTPPQSTPRHTQHATQPRVCAVVFVVCVSLSLCVAVCPLFPHSTQTTPRHPITTSTTHGAANAWANERMRRGSGVYTTAQTPATTTKSRCHPHHLLSFLPSIDHPHSSQHHHTITHAMRQDLLNTNTLADLASTHRL